MVPPAQQTGPSATFPLRLAAAGAAAVLTALATVTTADSDLWGHLRFGLDILSSWHLPTDDPYSFTQDLPWVNHEWLSELQMGAAYALAGVSGLALLKGLLVAGALGLAWLALGGVRADARIVLFATVVLGTVPVTRTLRPQLWSLLALVILCRVLLARETRIRRCLPLLFVIWANCHGGWIVGFGILGLWTAIEAIVERTIRPEPVVVLLACTLASLCTPYGWGLWQFLATTVSLSGRAITEWQPLWRSPAADSGPWIVAVAALVLFSSRMPWRRWEVTGVLALLAYASLSVVRIVPLYVLCTGVLLAPAFASRWPLTPERPARPSPGELPVAVGMLLAALAGAAWLLASSLSCVRIDPDHAPDTAAVQLLRSAEPGRLVTFFDWGEYALWHLSPTLRVSMDGRRETVYSDARLDEHGAILEGTPAGFDVLRGWRPEYVWLPATSGATKAWLAGEGYRLEHDSADSFVAVRSDLPRLERAQSDTTVPSCFPG